MKKYLAFCFIAAALNARAQSLPFDITIPPAPASNTVEANNGIRILPGYQTTLGSSYAFIILTNRYAHDPSEAVNNYNFIKTEEPYFDNYNSTSLADANPDQKNVTWQYFDGLGRPIQTVQGKASPDFRDIIIPVAYDQFGRQIREYLPYTVANDGRYQNALPTAQLAFYDPATAYKNKIKTDAAPFAEIKYEPSPLNRILEKGAPGGAWQPDPATPVNGKTMKSEYHVNVDGINADQETIKIWTLTAVTLNGKTEYLLSSSGSYPSGSLFVNVTKDEVNRQVREYVDKQDKVIARKVQDVNGPPAVNIDNQWTITYYSYDEFERLRFVLQPKFTDRNSVYDGLSDQQLKKNMIDSLTFEYRYDERGRMIYRRVPGAGQVEMVYDKWDRLVLSQDGNQRAASKWSFMKYDVMNRPVITGEIAITDKTRDQLASDVYAVGPRYETAANGNNIGYTVNQTYPATITLSDIYSITYYDDYSFKSNLGLGTAYDASIPSGFTGQVNYNVRTKVTGSKVRVLDSSPVQWLLSATYYDNRYRLLQSIADDHLGNKNHTTLEYYGSTLWVTKSMLQHGSALTSLTETEYDHRGRIKKVWQTMDNNAATKVLMAWNKYNDLGQLVEKNVHSTNSGATFLQSNDYRYNIRGWLTHLNNSQLSNDGTFNDDASDLFGMELKYNDAVTINGINTTAQYNGNISAMQWKTNNLKDAAVEKIYGFTYDPLNRLSEAKYGSKSGTAFTNDIDLFNEKLTYDKNGNIRRLWRRSIVEGTSVSLGGFGENIDDLSYVYKGNRLDAVTDNAPSAYKVFGFSENMALTTGEYEYDLNGNMDVDQNKGLVGPTTSNPKGVLYNHLNLPKEVRFGDKKIVYTYDAAGVKLLKIAYDESGTKISRTDYVGAIHYEGATPQVKFMATPEGRAVKNGAGWDYEYFHKDHLGNTRMVYGYQKQVDEYKATMETALSSTEEATFGNVSQTRQISLFNHTPASYHTPAPDKVAELNGALTISGTSTPRSVGPAKMLQVATGERVQLEVFARYQNPVGTNTSAITTLAAAVTGAYGLTSGEAAYQALSDNVPPAAGSFSKLGNSAKAYLFYILFDNNYGYNGQFGYAMVDNTAEVGFQRLYLDITIPADGYLYTYVINESNVSTSTSVYFDDFNIIHTRNTSALQVVQTTDYYPFGLGISALSFQKQSSLDNDYLYNGKELQDEHNLGWLDYGARMYMPEIGRWAVIDPLTETSRRWTPYRFAFNNPLRFIDPDGMAEEDKVKKVVVGTEYSDGYSTRNAKTETGSVSVTYHSAGAYKHAYAKGLAEAYSQSNGLSETSSQNNGSGRNFNTTSVSGEFASWKNQERNAQQGNDPPGDGRGSAMSFSFGFAAIFGISGEWGIVTDETGASKSYYTVSANFGLGVDLGVNYKEIVPTNGKSFRVDHYQGRGKNLSSGILFTSEGRGGNTTGNPNLNPFDFGITYKERSISGSPLMGTFLPVGLADVGWIYQMSNTNFYK